MVANEHGWTLIELLVVMALSTLIGGAAIVAIDSTQKGSAKTTARQEAVTEGEVALGRMTRETGQASAAAVQSATRIDLKTRVRPADGSASTLRRIRYDCATSSSCTRTDCGAAAGGTLIGLACTAVGPVQTVLKGVQVAELGSQLNGATLSTTVARESPNIDFVTFRLVVRLDDFTSGRESATALDPVELTGGVDLANIEN